MSQQAKNFATKRVLLLQSSEVITRRVENGNSLRLALQDTPLRLQILNFSIVYLK